LNAGLAHARARGDAGAYVAVLDADFVARPAFIRRALALFQDDPQVALVQTPQAYCNCDNFQRAFPRGRLPDSLRFVYETSLPARDVAGLANCLGTSFVVRRDALELVDGFPLESVTEDVVLSFKLWSAGYKTRYLNERLTRGWATDTLGEHLAQRERWALGFTQLANWQFGRRVGRSLGKRLLTYEACTRIVYSNIVRAIVTLVPVAYFWFGVTPWNLRPQTFYGLLVPLVVLHRWFLSRISVGRFVSGLSDAAFFLGAPGALRGLIMAFLPGARRFRVTSKAKPKGAVCVHWSSLVWSGFPLALLLVGMLQTQSQAQPLPEGWGLLASEGGMMFVWGLASLAVLTIAVLLSIELPERRRQPRLLCPGPAWLGGRSAFVERLDTQAAQIQLLDGDFKPDTGAELSFEVGGRVFEVKVARASAGRIVVTFPNDTETRRALIRTAYVVGEEPDWQGSSELELLRGVGWRLLPSAGWRASG
jgi:cellulose synthase (UDP-forming)